MSATLNRLTVARTSLVLDNPFFGSLALRLRFKEDTTCQTAWTDGQSLGYNPQFIDSLPINQIKALLAHEVMHCALMHHLRRDSRDFQSWNGAADYAINDILINSKFDLPQGCLHDPIYANQSAEAIYSKLQARPKPKQGQSGQLGQGKSGNSKANQASNFGEVRDGKGEQGQPLSQAELSQQAQSWQVATAQAAQQARAMGKLPSSLKRLIDTIIKPTVDWKEALRRFISEQAKNDYAMSPPNRRYVSQGLYLPSLRSEELGHIAIAIDTSGSIGRSELSQFAFEVTSILETYNVKATIVYCDAEVSKTLEVSSDDLPLKLSCHGGGGTSFVPVFKWIAEHMSEPPTCLVYLTDCEGQFPSASPEYPVLWASVNERARVPFGELIYVNPV
jgi:predicted metal-dependent peptidase